MALTRITKGVIKPNENYDTHNINSTGIVTAIGFKGPFTGSSDIQSGIITATKIDLNGDIDVDGHTNLDNVSIAGVTTAAGAIDLNADLDVDGHTNLDNVSIAGVTTFAGAISGTTASFSGNVSIGGTLTYEDVTNIDSVGIITARDGLKVLAGGANVVGVVTATSFVGGLPISNEGNDRIITSSGSGVVNAEANLQFDGTNLFMPNELRHLGDPDTKMGFDTDTIKFETAGDERLRITSAGRIGIGTAIPANLFEVVGGDSRFYNADKSKETLIADGRLELIRDDSLAYIDFATISAEDFDCRIQQFGNGLRFYTGGQGSADERLLIKSDGDIRAGDSANTWAGDRLEVAGTKEGVLGLANYGSTASEAGIINFYRSISGTVGSDTVPTDNIGGLTFRGWSGDAYQICATIGASTDGTWNSSGDTTDTPGKLTFSTTPDGSSACAERLRITASGRIDILGDGGNAGFTLSNSYGQAGFFGGMYYNGSSWTRNAIGTRIGAGMYVNTGGHIAFLKSTETSGTSATVTESLRITSGGEVNIGGNYTQTTAPLCVTTSANDFGIRLQSGSNVVTEILNNDAAGNSEIRGYYNNNSGTRGEGYRLESNGDTFFNPGGVTGLKIRANNGYVGAGKGTPGCALDVLNTADQLVARFLSNHTTLGGGVQIKNNNARGGVEFLYKDGTNVGAFYHSTGGWTWDKELQLVGTAKLRIGTTSGNSLLNVDSGDGTDGHIIATFNGEESSNHAGFNIAHYLCGSDDNRTGLYWEHQNVSNERMWMGDDKRLYLKNSNPTSSTQNGRYIMTVDAGYPDFPDGSSADNAAYSAIQIKKHYPNSQTGNYWIYDYNGTPRQIRCDMEIDGGGWMLWNDYNTSSTSMNEALGGSSTSPHSGLGRGNYNNYARYQVLIRASKISDGTQEALHTIVQLDHNGNLFRKYDYGEEFFREDVGDPFTPTLSQYFQAGTGEYIKIDGAYQPQLGASGWQTFSGGGWSQVWIRELDSRLSPGDVRSYAMHERIYGFNDNGVPIWNNTSNMGVQPYWTDIRGSQFADGSTLDADGLNNENIRDRGHTLYSNNGNNGDVLHGRCHGVFLGTFEIAFELSYWWGWAVGNLNAGIGVEEQIRDGVAWPYYQNSSLGYAGFGLMNNSSNNKWYPSHFYNGQSAVVGNSGSGYSGGSNGEFNIMWRESDGTIKVRRRGNTHGTYTFGKFVGPLVFGNGYQSPSFTRLGMMWDAPWNQSGADMR